MPVEKDTGEKPWPEVWLVRRPAYTNFPAQHTESRALAEAYVRMWDDDSVPPVASEDIERYLPLQVIRERLEAEADKLEAQNLAGDGPSDLTAATVRAVKAQGIRDALDAAFSKEEGP